MSQGNWNGARWWKFDLHTHTPASHDYGKGSNQASLRQLAPREWLLDYMRAGIDCVAVTDHNSGTWVDLLKAALAELESEKPEGFQSLCLFPGVEVSVQGGVHVLAILGVNKTTSDIDTLLGAVGFAGTKGKSDDVTSKSFGDVVAEIGNAGGIAIPAHVDSDSGLFRLPGTTLAQALENRDVFAMEVVDPAGDKPQIYVDEKLSWAEVLGSDSHHPSGDSEQQCVGSRFTWVKMGSPSVEGLRLALLDGALSVCRSDQESGDPNEHAPWVIEAVEVGKARYMGRAQPFALRLNPWLNAIVGGRGTGKSTIVEFLRLALRRERELPDELRSEYEKYSRVYPNREDGGLLTEAAEIRVVYRKDGSKFRAQWSPTGDLDAIEEEVDGEWRGAAGDVSQRFPVRIYSQKQIFHLARTPLALLNVVDEAPGVDRRSWNARWGEEEGRFLSVRAKAREIEAGLSEEPRLRGELEDIKRKQAIFEDAGHSDVLKALQRRRSQRRAVEAWEEGWGDAGDRLRGIAAELVPDLLDDASLDAGAEEDSRLNDRARATRDSLDELRQTLEGLAAQADEIRSKWQAARDESAWKRAVDEAIQAYETLRTTLSEEGAGDPAAYGELVQRRQAVERRLQELADRKTQVSSLRDQAIASLDKLLVLRRELTTSRELFLQKVLEGNQYVQIRVVAYQALDSVEGEFRRLLQKESGFDNDIGSPNDKDSLLGRIYAGSPGANGIERSLEKVKEHLHKIAQGSDPIPLADQRFANHIRRLQPEALDRLDLWFPEDTLDVQYSTTGDERFRSIQEGSPGQKTAALLAFLLSYGDEPLILDQPEDDLDNHLIYELIVTQLKEVKRRRQIVVITHNPNIVVNGDAELVVALRARGGETQIECQGSLQEDEVRDVVCAVMEGGRAAFEDRYRRIMLGGRHV